MINEELIQQTLKQCQEIIFKNCEQIPDSKERLEFIFSALVNLTGNLVIHISGDLANAIINGMGVMEHLSAWFSQALRDLEKKSNIH